jgi:hypothetical protein
MSTDAKPRRERFWHVPIHIVAGVLAVFSVLAGLMAERHEQLEPWISVTQYGLASASLTFTFARVISRQRVTIREVELFVLAVGGLILREIARYVVAMLMALGIFFLLIS